VAPKATSREFFPSVLQLGVHPPGDTSILFVARGPSDHFDSFCREGALRPPGPGPPKTIEKRTLASLRAGGRNIALASLSAGAFGGGVLSLARSLPVLCGLSRGSRSTHKHTQSPAPKLRTCQSTDRGLRERRFLPCPSSPSSPGALPASWGHTQKHECPFVL
jgi:hypothetical protein